MKSSIKNVELKMFIILFKKIFPNKLKKKRIEIANNSVDFKTYVINLITSLINYLIHKRKFFLYFF